MSAFTLDFRPNEANAYCKPNEHLRFGYPVKNLDGTPYNEPFLTDVEVKIFDRNDPIAKKIFNYSNNSTSHQSGTNIIAFDLSIVDAELPVGKYTWSINHKRTINTVIENNVMFEGFFEVTNKHRSGCDIIECNVGNINIVNVAGLREELDLVPKMAFFSHTFEGSVPTPNQSFTVTVSDGNFFTKSPFISMFIEGVYYSLPNEFFSTPIFTILSDTQIQISVTVTEDGFTLDGSILYIV